MPLLSRATKEFMYDVHGGLIAGILFVLVIVAVEIGFRPGFFRGKDPANDASGTPADATQSSTPGIPALLLAFTFSLSLQRFDTRSEAAVDEASAIGTAYLRARLLPAPLRDDVQALLRGYLDLRVQAGSLSMIHDEWALQTTKATHGADRTLGLCPTRSRNGPESGY